MEQRREGKAPIPIPGLPSPGCSPPSGSPPPPTSHIIQAGAKRRCEAMRLTLVSPSPPLPCPPTARLLSPRPSLLTPTSDARTHASPQKPLDLKQLKQRAAAIPPIVSPGPPSHGQDPHPAWLPRDPMTVTSWWGDNKSG